MKFHPRRAMRLTIAVVAASLAAFAGIASPANAAPVDPTKDGTSSLTVHKYEGAPTDAANDGSELTTEPALAGLNGVEFTITPLMVDGAFLEMDTNLDWAIANAIYEELGTSNPTRADFTPELVVTVDAVDYSITLEDESTEILTSGGTATSGATAVFSNLGFGYYLVEETAYPAGTTPAAPFLVSVPLTNPAGDGWLYDVHVYPKNSTSTVTKTVDDDTSIKLGDPVVFTITGDIPDGPIVDGALKLDGYKIVDDLDPKLDYVSATVTLSNGVPLILGDDYTLTPATATTGGPSVEVIFTGPGLDKLEINATAQVIVTINTTVNTVGEIVNTALLYPNLGSFTITPGQPGGPIDPEEPVVTKWGGVTVNKVDEAGAALPGAVFQVWASLTGNFADATVVQIPGDEPFTYTADVDGKIVVDGLRYSNWANNMAVAPGDSGYITYYLVETVAPDGYELLPEPIQFAVTGQSVDVQVTVENVPSNGGPELPFTGGVGTTLFYGIGALILGGGVVLALRARRLSA